MLVSSVPRGLQIFLRICGRQLHIQVFSKMVLRKGVLIEVRKVFKQVMSLVFSKYILPQPPIYLLNNNTMIFRDIITHPQYFFSLSKIRVHASAKTCYDITCGVPCLLKYNSQRKIDINIIVRSKQNQNWEIKIVSKPLLIF